MSKSGFHYFVEKEMTRGECIEAKIVNEILKSNLDQTKRESSVEWELKHSSGVIQMARILAQKRGVNEELAVISAGLHDIYVIRNGSYNNHAQLGGAIAKKILEDSGQFSKVEILQIGEAVSNHSDKHIYSNSPLVELVKDADLLDVFSYGDKIYDYKPTNMLIHYYKRIIKIREEMGLPKREYFSNRLTRIC